MLPEARFRAFQPGHPESDGRVHPLLSFSEVPNVLGITVPCPSVFVGIPAVLHLTT